MHGLQTVHVRALRGNARGTIWIGRGNGDIAVYPRDGDTIDTLLTNFPLSP